MRRLPGIAFDPVPSAPTEALPRMDIAVFVGFAATGPLHVPVPVESVAQYSNVFGPDLPLAWDNASGQRMYAHLGPTVRAFFSNGGRRCWVIRVARSEALECIRGTRYAENLSASPSVATYNHFPLGGLLAATGDGIGTWQLQPGMARARCEGSWCDGLLVQTALSKQTITIEALPAVSPDKGFTFATTSALSKGDVVRIDDSGGTLFFAAVESVSVASSASSTKPARYDVVLGHAAAFRTPPLGSPESVLIGDVFLHTRAESSRKYLAYMELDTGGTTAQITLSLAPDSPPQEPDSPPQIGTWALFETIQDKTKFWMRIDRVGIGDAGTTSPPTGLTLQGRVWVALSDCEPALSPSVLVQTADVLTIDIGVRTGADASVSLKALGLAPGHPRDWNAQPTDEAFYGPKALASTTSVTSSDSSDTPAQRFPLAGTVGKSLWADPNANSGCQTQWLIPLAVDPNFGDALGPLTQSATALERDGLQDFDPGLFLDPDIEYWRKGQDLESHSLEVLANLADFLRYESPAPRPLFGIHAALGFNESGIADEATLIAVPDAIHPGWEQSAVVAREGPAGQVPFTRPEWLGHDRGCLDSVMVARPDLSAKAPEWSRFLDCDLLVVPAPEFVAPANPDLRSTYSLMWSPVQRVTRYVLEEARLNDYSDAREIYVGNDDHFELIDRESGRYFYRVRAVVDNATSDWSTSFVDVADTSWRLKPTDRFADDGRERELLDVHRALLRMCAAKGELLAVLSLPKHYREPDALDYPRKVAAGISENSALSFGALYHPWLIDKRVDESYFGYPPDGSTVGVLSARATSRGAWIAPANEVMKDVIALSPTIRRERWQELQDAQVNIIRQEPRGFLVMDEDTLSDDEDLRPVCVRRLLILLRRLALRRGANYVFEPNDDAFRRLVQRAFDGLLSNLFDRGAFAGRTPAQSFQVVTDASINTPQSIDAGRFIVDLKVAPSVPMSFLTVRLQQVGERLTVTEGR